MPDLLTDAVARPRFQVLTEAEFDVLWERLGLGPTPAALQLASPGRTAAERREVLRAGWHGLRERGLAGPSGPDPEVARLLHLLARPERQLELRGVWSHTVRAVAAVGSGAGVLAMRQDATITLAACSSPAWALHEVLPPRPAGPGRAATVPSSVLAAAISEHRSGMRAALLERGVPRTEAGLLDRMLAPGPGRAQVVSLATDTVGVARRTGGVLGVLDGPGGRYLLTRRVGDDAVEWSTVAPVDARGLQHRMAVMLDVS